MAGVETKSLDAPDEVRTPDKTRVDVVTVGASEVGRFTFQPGWCWSECIQPVVGTDSCQAEHLGYADRADPGGRTLGWKGREDGAHGVYGLRFADRAEGASGFADRRVSGRGL